MRIVVHPRVAASNRSKISISPRTSSCAVGSSRITTPAPSRTPHNARASATRCHWPPDRSVPPSYARDSVTSSPARRPALARSSAPARRHPTCGPSRLPRRHVLAQRELVAHEVLEDGCDARPPDGQIEVAQIHAVHADRARCRVVQPAQQLDECRLARAVLADDGERRTRPGSPRSNPSSTRRSSAG